MKHSALAVVLCLCRAASLAAQDKSSDHIIQFYQWRIARDPDDYFNYDKLGVAYIQKGRETGDISYYELAEKSLRKSLDLESSHREALPATLHLASVYFAEHRFRDALDYAQKALTFGSGDISPYATIGDALLEMGEYDKASEAYSNLEESGSSPAPHRALVYLQESRSSNLEFLRGNPQGSIRHMRKAVETAVQTQMPKESIAWTQFTLGEEFFQTGDLTNAELAEQNALATYPGYHRALAALAKIYSAQGRFGDCIELYKKAIAAVPLPTYAASLGDVYTRLGRNQEAKKEYDLIEFIAHLSAIAKTVYNRDLALFYADHDMKLAEALELARKELEIRRDIYTWDCLAWASYKNGKTSEAAEAISRALSLGTKDSLLYFHAGMIYLGLRDATKAKDYLTRALAINAHFHVLYADVAEEKLRDIDKASAQAQNHGRIEN